MQYFQSAVKKRIALFASVVPAGLVFFLQCMASPVALPTKGAGSEKRKPRIPHGQLYTRTYDAELKRLAQAHKTKDGQTDPSFRYAPAVLRPAKPNEIKRNGDGGSRIAGEVLIQLHAGQSDGSLLAQLKKEGIECVLVGFVPAFRLVQLRLNDDSKAMLERIRRLPAVKLLRRHGVHAVREAPSGKSPAKEKKKKTASPAKLPKVNKHVWQVIDFRIHSAWPRSKGKGVRVAIIDSGLDLSVPEFKGRVVAPYSVITRSEKFQDGVFKRNGEPLRVINHGTAVATMVAGETPGVAPGASIMPIQVLGFSVIKDRIITHDLAILEGIARAIEFKADIINISLGSDFKDILKAVGPSNQQVRSLVLRKIQEAAGRNMRIFDEAFRACEERGIPVVVSAGNEGVPAMSQPLARHPYTISVGAIDREGRKAGFSNHGPIVDTFAPGEWVAAIGAGNSYSAISGTSFSAPYVVGLIALARGLGIKAKAPRIRQALRDSNELVNLSILPSKALPVVAPIAFLNHLGAKLPPMKAGRLQGNFEKKYAVFKVKPGDSPHQEMEKILLYFQKRKTWYKEWPESRRLIALAKNNFEAVYKIFQDDEPESPGPGNGGFYLMVVLKKIKLSQSQLSRLSGITHPRTKYRKHDYNHDYMAILFRAKGYKPALAWMYRRLKEKNYNYFTLGAVAELGGRGAFPRIREFWKRTQKRREFGNLDIQPLTALIKSAGKDSGLRRTAHGLAGISYDRYTRHKSQFDLSLSNAVLIIRSSSEPDRFFGYYINYMIEFSEVFLEFEDRRFLTIACDILDILEPFRANPKKLTDATDWLKKIQGLLNRNTDFGFKYNYQSPAAKRKEALAKFRAASKFAIFERGKFRR